MKFTVITPTYNRAHLIERAIKSIQIQTYTNWELIIVDDGSTDGTEDVIKKYSCEERIRYLRLDSNRGVNAARNAGIEVATGDYITFLDSDDEFLERSLEQMHDWATRMTDISVFAFKTDRTRDMQTEDVLILEFEDIVSQKVRGEHLFVVRSQALKGCEFPEEINGGESITWFQLARLHRFAYVNKCLRIYHRDNESLTRGGYSDTKKLMANKQVYETYLQELREVLLQYNPKGHQGYTKIMVNLAKTNILLGNVREGVSQTVETLKYDIFELRAYRNILLLVRRAVRSILLKR